MSAGAFARGDMSGCFVLISGYVSRDFVESSPGSKANDRVVPTHRRHPVYPEVGALASQEVQQVHLDLG